MGKLKYLLLIITLAASSFSVDTSETEKDEFKGKLVLIHDVGIEYFPNKSGFDENGYDKNSRIYGKKDNSIYLLSICSNMMDAYCPILVPDVDIATFEVLKGYGWGAAKDKNNAYVKDKKVQGADRDTFELMQYEYFRDKNNVYFNDEKIDNADRKTFEVLNFSHAKDKNNAYFNGEKIDGADPSTFEAKDYWNSKDKNNTYVIGKKVEK